MASSLMFQFTAILVMVTWTVCGAIPIQRAQDAVGEPISLPLTGSTVVVSCANGILELGLTNRAPLGHTARIQIGPGGEGCGSGTTYLPSPKASTSAGNTCNRQLVTPVASEDPEKQVYLWTVRVEELINPENKPIAKPFAATFPVRCEQRAEVPPSVAVPLPPAVTEEAGDFVAPPIEFRLTRVETPQEPNKWTLDLRPQNDAALGGLNYAIIRLRATPTGVSGETLLDFVTEGCPAAGYGTKVNRAGAITVYTIILDAFQFSDHPGIGIDFSADVRLCPGPDRCDAVCPSPSEAGRAVPEQKQKRSLNPETVIGKTRSNTVTAL